METITNFLLTLYKIKLVKLFVIISIIMYILLTPKIVTSYMKQLFDDKYIRLVFLIVLVFISKKNLQIGLMLSIAYLISISIPTTVESFNLLPDEENPTSIEFDQTDLASFPNGKFYRIDYDKYYNNLRDQKLTTALNDKQQKVITSEYENIKNKNIPITTIDTTINQINKKKIYKYPSSSIPGFAADFLNKPIYFKCVNECSNANNRIPAIPIEERNACYAACNATTNHKPDDHHTYDEFIPVPKERQITLEELKDLYNTSGKPIDDEQARLIMKTIGCKRLNPTSDQNTWIWDEENKTCKQINNNE